ncbi:CASP-like protein 4A3 [Sesamum alatum]|uniref:CASP-like protein n=1 Tax=Sesamum alatum TaxID=300844 RepID=A0AAE1XUC4_9LAMI|nr:CASP-like protein 4A3 [Sesamum alatum]
MENQNKQQTSPAPDVTVTDSKQDSGEHISLSPPLGSPGKSPSDCSSSSLHSKQDSGEHISLSPPVGSPGKLPSHSYSSPLHSKHSSGEHISLSPPVGSPGSSLGSPSLSSHHTPVNSSHGSLPEDGKPQSPENKPPPAVVSRDVFKEPMEHKVVIEEPMAVVSRVVLEEPKAVANRAVAEEPKTVAPKTDPAGVVVEDRGGDGSERRRFRPSLSILRRAKREKTVKRAALGFRVFGFLFCLVSFSVMAADRNQGWALDSFDRYKEFRYCMSVNVLGFVYSAAQAFDLSYNLVTGKYIVQHQQRLRYYFDFAVDQTIAYLLISASSSATIRIDDWQLNWGKDKFPDMATASISMSFLAFVALASSSLISGYALCTSKTL